MVATGVTREDGTAVAVGDHIEAGVWLDASGALTLDFSIDTRVEVDPGSRVQVGAARASELIVARGGVRGLLAPVPNSQRAPLHVGTPSTSVELGGDGDVYVALIADGRAEVFVLSGLARLFPGTLEPDGRPTLLVVPAGAQSGPLPGADGVTTIEAARARLAEARADDDHRIYLDVATQVARLDDALDGLDVEDRERLRLLAETPAAGSEAARRRVADLVRSGQHLLWRRAALLARWELAVATSGTADAEGRAPVIARRQKVLDRVGTVD